jgi:hypothetical protein
MASLTKNFFGYQQIKQNWRASVLPAPSKSYFHVHTSFVIHVSNVDKEINKISLILVQLQLY